MDPSTLHWLAGILEGEGSFLKGPPSQPKYPRVVLQMKDEDVVAKAARVMGGRSYHKSKAKKRKWSDTFKTSVKGGPAVRLMKELRPLMGVRRQSQIDEAISSYSGKEPFRYRWPSDIRLLSMRQRMGWRPLAKKLGVSFTAVRRRVARIESSHSHKVRCKTMSHTE